MPDRSARAVRKVSSLEWQEVARVCADTGAGGEPVDPLERDAFAEHWVSPYRELRPDWTWVAVAGREIVGYLTAAPDSIEFEKERRRTFAPGPDSREFFPQAVRFRLWREHPAHLMLAVLPAHRGVGVGARLLQAFFAELRRAGVPSAHLFCGPSSYGFFERMAFRTEALVQPAEGVVLRAMTRPAD